MKLTRRNALKLVPAAVGAALLPAAAPVYVAKPSNEVTFTSDPLGGNTLTVFAATTLGVDRDDDETDAELRSRILAVLRPGESATFLVGAP